MRIADYLKEKRLTSGYSIEELSARTNIDYSIIYELELHDDELDNLTLPMLRKLCQGLGINPTEILKTITSDIESLPLSSLLKSRREAMGYTTEKLADLIGYEQWVVEAMEGQENDAEVCIDALKLIAMELYIPLPLIFAKL